MFKKIVNSISSFIKRSGSIYVRGLTSYEQLDLEKIKNKFQLKEEAAERGQKNHPPTNSKSLDDIELKVTSLIDDELRKTQNIFKCEQAAFESRINSLKLSGYVERLGGIAGSAETDFESAALQIKNDKHVARSAVDELERHMDNFKHENNLNRPARYPDSSKNTFVWSVIFFLVVMESLLNASFLKNGDEMGWIGGVSFSIMASIMNVCFACVLGIYTSKRLTHVKLITRVSGYISLAIFISLGIIVNLALAHYRSAMVIDAANAAELAKNTLFTTPFGLSDIKSWFLFAIGCVFSFGAAIKISKMDDPYLGYGDIDRERKESISSYHSGTQDVLNELMMMRDDFLSQLQAIHNSSISGKFEFKSICDNISLSISTFNDHLNHLENAGNFLLACYRDKNIETRVDAAPERFHHEFSLGQETIKDDHKYYEELMQEIKQDPLMVDKAYKKNSAKIETAYKNAMKIIETIDEIKD